MRKIIPCFVFTALLGMITPAVADWQVVQDLPFEDRVETVLAFDDVVYCTSYLGFVYYRDPATQLFTAMGQGQFHNAGVSSLAVSGDQALLSLVSWGSNWSNQRVDGQWGQWEALADQENNYHQLTFVGDLVFATRSDGLVVSDDVGQTWQPSTLITTDYFDSIVFVDGVLLAHTGSTAFNDPGGELFVSHDRGQTWINSTAEISYGRLASSCSHKGSLFLSIFRSGLGQFVYRSDDSGLSWEQVSNWPNIYAIHAMVSAEGLFFSGGTPSGGAEDSAYYSTDLASWNLFTQGLPTTTNQIVSMVYADGKLFCTNASIMTMSDLPVVSAVDQSPQGLSQVRLDSYPNPFNPRTTVSYQLPEGTRTPVLGIYDLAGRLIRRALLSTTVLSGEYSWNGRDDGDRAVPSGLYLVRLGDGKKLLATHRMQLVR